jgi:hypothetical protein
MALKPTCGMANHCLKRSRLGKKMARAWNDHQALRAAQPRQRLLIELDHTNISTPDDEKRRGAHDVESISRKSGRPPRETTAPIRRGSLAAATRAAAAPVLAPNSPIGSFAIFSCPSTQCTASTTLMIAMHSSTYWSGRTQTTSRSMTSPTRVCGDVRPFKNTFRQEHIPSIMPFGDYADQFPILEHRQRPDVLTSHQFDGGVHCFTRTNRPNTLPFCSRI